MANIKATTIITSLIKNNTHNVIYDYSREIKNLNDKTNTLTNNTYTKAEVDNLIANLSVNPNPSIDLSNYYTINKVQQLFLSKEDATKTYATKEQTWGAKANVIGVFAKGSTLILQDDCIPDFATEIHDGDTVDTMENAIASYGAIKYFQVGCLTESEDPEMLALNSFNLDGDYYLVTDAYVDAKIDAIDTAAINTLKEYYTHNKQHYVTIEWDDKNDGFKNIPVSDYSEKLLLTGTVEDGELLVRCAANYTLNFDFIKNLAQTGDGEVYNFRLDSNNYEVDSDSNAYPRFRLILSCKDSALAQVNYIIKKGWNLNGKYVAVDKTVAVNADQKVLLDVDLVLMNITVTTIDNPPSSINIYNNR